MKRKLGLLCCLSVVLVVGALLLAGCGPKEKDKLVVIAWGGTYGEAFDAAVVQPFQEKYGVEVEVVTPGSSTEILAKLRAEKGNQTTDLVQVGGFLEPTFVAEGLVADIDYPSVLENWDDLYEPCQANPKFGPGASLAATGLLYNSAELDYVPDSWMDLWDPDLAGSGKVAIFNMDANYQLGLFVIINEMMGGTSGEGGNIEPGFEKFAELMSSHHPLISGGTDDAASYVVQSSALISVCTQSRSIELIANGYDVGFAYPKEGTFSWPTSIGVVEGCENEELAVKFIDFFISPEVNADFCKRVNYSLANSKADLSDYEYGEYLAADSIYDIDWEWVNSQRANWIENWNINVLSLL